MEVPNVSDVGLEVDCVLVGYVGRDRRLIRERSQVIKVEDIQLYVEAVKVLLGNTTSSDVRGSQWDGDSWSQFDSVACGFAIYFGGREHLRVQEEG